jgi:hypothetical protein
MRYVFDTAIDFMIVVLKNYFSYGLKKRYIFCKKFCEINFYM